MSETRSPSPMEIIAVLLLVIFFTLSMAIAPHMNKIIKLVEKSLIGIAVLALVLGILWIASQRGFNNPFDKTLRMQRVEERRRLAKARMKLRAASCAVSRAR